MSEITTLSELFGLVRARIITGLEHREAAARLPVLATRDAQGWPSVRTMVLRGFDAGDWTLDMHSDADAAKVLQLTDGPRAALQFWDAEAALQVRMRAHVIRLPHEEEKALWERVPEAARAQYGTVPPPGTPIASAEAWRPNPRPAR
ncbi:pyridoxamine 5'-phosphate oxidase family protein, partial [Limimaricola sp. ASW11-118]